jgi:hypothetical protein
MDSGELWHLDDTMVKGDPIDVEQWMEWSRVLVTGMTDRDATGYGTICGCGSGALYDDFSGQAAYVLTPIDPN